MQPSAQVIYSYGKTSHEEMYKKLAALKSEIDRCNNFAELCDYAFAVDGAHKFIEDLKKELWKFRESINKKVCELWLQAAQSHLNSGQSFDRSIRTDYVTATPNIGQAPNIPKASGDNADPEGYKKLMDYLGIDTSKWARKEDGELSEVVKIHWPGIVALVTERLSAGLPCPPGIDVSKMLPVYKLTLRKRRDVLDSIDSIENVDERIESMEEHF